MDSPNLGSLPSIALHLICGYIRDTSPGSLRAFSAVNSSCYHAAVPFIHRNLTIRISGRESLVRDVADLTENHLRQKCLQHTRRLELSGTMPRLEEESTEGIPASDWGYFERDPQLNTVFSHDSEEDGPDESSRAWSPMVSLISRLQYLTDLHYACGNQFPPCLLKALHQHHPACRLDIRTFRLRSLRDPMTDPNEVALLTSPCLHSMSVRYVWRDSDGHDDYNEEAAMRTVSLAPNLKHLKMLGCRAASSPALHFSSDVPRKPWTGFIPPVERFQIGSLESLSFCGYQDLTKMKLDEWSRYTDLSRLRSLVLREVSDAELLMDIGVNARFKSLDTLKIILDPEKDDLNFRPAIEMFFDSLNPLTKLWLSGSLDAPLIARVLDRHGGTLRELKLRPYESLRSWNTRDDMMLSSADILLIQTTCPLLEDLKLSLKRSKSDRRETQCYEALGNFKSLTKLQLHLNCSSPRALIPPGAAEDDFDREVYEPYTRPRIYNAHVRDALINSAIDMTLATSIWEIISASKPGPPLASLRIASGGGEIFRSTSADMMLLVEHMSRSFLLTRSERDDSDYVKIEEVGEQTRKTRDEKRRAHEARIKEKCKHTIDDKMKRIFERLWPPKAGSQDWRDDWSSWPLQKTEESS